MKAAVFIISILLVSFCVMAQETEFPSAPVYPSNENPSGTSPLGEDPEVSKKTPEQEQVGVHPSSGGKPLGGNNLGGVPGSVVPSPPPEPVVLVPPPDSIVPPSSEGKPLGGNNLGGVPGSVVPSPPPEPVVLVPPPDSIVPPSSEGKPLGGNNLGGVPESVVPSPPPDSVVLVPPPDSIVPPSSEGKPLGGNNLGGVPEPVVPSPPPDSTVPQQETSFLPSENIKNSGGAFSVDEGDIPILQRFNYDSEGRRDPFQPYRDLEAELAARAAKTAASKSAVVIKESGPIFPLARWSIDQIKLIATRLSSKEPRAMFLAPNNQKFTLGKGERIGNNNGYIGTIYSEEVIVIEPVIIKGEPHLVTRVMKLRN